MPVFANEERTNGITRAVPASAGASPRSGWRSRRRAPPTRHATLLLNDFDLSTAYECLIEGVLEAGIRIDAIGLQSHMHQGYWGEEKTLAMLDRFARYGLPLHLTESTLLSGAPHAAGHRGPQRLPDPVTGPRRPEGEARQAEEIVRHYRTLRRRTRRSQAITYWGLTDDGAWLGAPVGLGPRRRHPQAAYDALHGLIKGEWWLAPTTLRTDAEGRVPVRGFLGDYRVTASGATASFTLGTAGAVSAEATLGSGPSTTPALPGGGRRRPRDGYGDGQW